MLFSRREVFAGGLAAMSSAALTQPSGSGLAFELEVPVDHTQPEGPHFSLPCEWGAPRQANRQTIVVVADAQQFYVRPGGAARLQTDLFGNAFNVVAVVGRSRAPGLTSSIIGSEAADWNAACRLLSWRQWAGDIAVLIGHLALRPGELGLYGRSGGAHLIHQLLTLRPTLNARVYLQAAVNHDLDVRWGLSADHFWEQFSTSDPAVARDLLALLRREPGRRRDAVLVFQRQHFFETLEALPAARLAAARAFLASDAARIADMRERYQLDAIERTRSTLEGVGAAVRVAEFASPHADPRADAGPLRPDVEALFYYAHPLEDPPLSNRERMPATDWSVLRTQSAEVLQVAGRHDHTCDYRTQIGLSGLTRDSSLLLLDDDHVFKRWAATGTQSRLIREWFAGGAASPGFRRETDALGPLRYREF